MKKIIFFIFLFLCIKSFSQQRNLNLYAERRNIDNTIDSFYIDGIERDSVFSKQGVYICPSVESFLGHFQPVFPESFGRFIKYADGIYRSVRYYSGYPVSVITIHATASANLILTDHPNSEQPLVNSQRSAVRVNTSAFLQARLTAIVIQNSASVNSPRLYFQYSTDGVNWIGDGSGGNISLSTNGAKETTWVDLPAGAIGDVYIRVAQAGGNGSADPSLGTVTIQFR